MTRGPAGVGGALHASVHFPTPCMYTLPRLQISRSAIALRSFEAAPLERQPRPSVTPRWRFGVVQHLGPHTPHHKTVPAGEQTAGCLHITRGCARRRRAGGAARAMPITARHQEEEQRPPPVPAPCSGDAECGGGAWGRRSRMGQQPICWTHGSTSGCSRALAASPPACSAFLRPARAACTTTSTRGHRLPPLPEAWGVTGEAPPRAPRPAAWSPTPPLE